MVISRWAVTHGYAVEGMLATACKSPRQALQERACLNDGPASDLVQDGGAHCFSGYPDDPSPPQGAKADARGLASPPLPPEFGSVRAEAAAKAVDNTF